MLIKLYRFAIWVLSPLNVFPTRQTEKGEITVLLESLWPIDTKTMLIRLGSDGDGGYLVPDDLVGIEACFSPGVSTVSNFEKDCAALGMKVFLADGSVDIPAAKHDLFTFRKQFIGAITNDQFLTLDEWVSSSLPGTDSDLLLQMDIEGHEWVTLLAAPTQLMTRFRILVVEFHNLDQLWSKPFFRLVQPAIEKILKTHSCVHIHPNNSSGDFEKSGVNLPPTMEFTFLRHDRISCKSHRSNFPHPLDRDNTERASISLPKCWYGGD